MKPAVQELQTGNAPQLGGPTDSCLKAQEWSQRDLLRKAVAELPDKAIRDMSSRELRFAIRTAGELLIPPLEEQQLEFADRATLERLVFLTRRACRQGLGEPNGKASMRRLPR